MRIRTSAILCAARPHGEVGVIARLMTQQHGLIAAYVSGGRGRALRPVLIPGNGIEAELNARVEGQMPSARVELTRSRAPFLAEPLPAAAMGWACALTATALPERHAYPAIFGALDALLEAVCSAPSARGWAPGLVAYEALVLRELGYGSRFGAGVDGQKLLAGAMWSDVLEGFARTGAALARYVLADHRHDVMGARERLHARLSKIEP